MRAGLELEQLDLEVLAAIDQPPAGRSGARQTLHVPCTPAAEGSRATGRNESESIAEPALGALYVDDGEGNLVELLRHSVQNVMVGRAASVARARAISSACIASAGSSVQAFSSNAVASSLLLSPYMSSRPCAFSM